MAPALKRIKRVPSVLQMEAAECGAACLSMILAYHGKPVQLERLRIECGVSRDGVNANSIVLAAGLHNLESTAYSRDIQELGDLPLPAIIHWKFNHFVVLCGKTKKGFVINDPAIGRLRVSYEEFDKSFTGIVLCFEKGKGFEKTKKKRNGFVVRLLKENPGALIFVSLLGFVIAITGIVIPVLSQLFINDVLLAQNPQALNPIILGMSAVLIVMSAAAILRTKYLMKLKAKLALVSSARFMWKMMSLPLEFFSQRFAGELAARQSANDEVADVFCSRFVPAALNLLMLIIYFAVLLSINKNAALLGAAAAAINAGIIIFTSGGRKNLTIRLQRDLGQYEGSVAAGIDMMETIMACGSEDGFFQIWTGYAGKAANSKSESIKKSLYINAIPAFILAAVNISILMMGVYEILAGRLTVGALVALQALLTIFLSPVSDLVESASAAQSVKGQIGRLEDTQNYPVREIYRKFISEMQDIQIKNLTFAYNPFSEPVINNLSFDVKHGCQLALTGGSGCGKSTVAKLIAGLYEPASGQILFGGKAREQIDRDVFYSSLAVVDQEVILFEGAVMENITMWDESISHEDAVQAAKDACIHDDITARPGGYSSPVLADGQNFSGGQKQRIEIARALAKNPSILIMDEATSALDAKTEEEVTKAVKRRGITSIIIAHRLSAIRDCDEIIVLEKGRIAERGVHDELKDSGGLYSKLINTSQAN